jgi:hypothetical protein
LETDPASAARAPGEIDIAEFEVRQVVGHGDPVGCRRLLAVRRIGRDAEFRAIGRGSPNEGYANIKY